MPFAKAVILGATGPVGIDIADELRKRGVAVRAVSRNMGHLEALFPGLSAERVAADLLKPDDTKRAVDGCDVVFHCVGFGGDAMQHHRTAAENLAAALAGNRPPRCVHVSSYWAFLPLVGNPLNEDHPRQGGPPWVRHRRAAEDILREAGAAIVNLPDFYGPHVHTSTLQQPLAEAAQGKTMHWIGALDVEREYAFVPDAARTIVSLAERDEAYGEHWLIPTAGPLNGRRAAEIVNEILVSKIKVRGLGKTSLRVLGWFNAPLRGMMQIIPEYVKPIRYETLKITNLLGPQPVTPYEDGIRQTLDWLRSRAE
ncbi:MAG TPA: NAD(P)H-binding protein [Gammaproteobacteria bacterium]